MSAPGNQHHRVRRPDLLVALARDMIEVPQPIFCRRGAEVLGGVA